MRSHSPSSRRSPHDGGRDARGVGSVIERTLPVTLPVIVVAVSRWDCGPVGMRASRGRLAFSMIVFVSFRGRTRGKKNIGRAISPARQRWGGFKPSFLVQRASSTSYGYPVLNILIVNNTRVFRAPGVVETKPSSFARRHSERRDRRAKAPVDVGGCASGLGYPSCRDRRRRWCRSSASETAPSPVSRRARLAFGWQHHRGRRARGRGATRVVSVGAP